MQAVALINDTCDEWCNWRLVVHSGSVSFVFFEFRNHEALGCPRVGGPYRVVEGGSGSVSSGFGLQNGQDVRFEQGSWKIRGGVSEGVLAIGQLSLKTIGRC